VEEAIAKRRSVRRYGPVELSLDEIGQLLWSAQGITGDHPKRRAAPSAGGRHPLIFYVCRSDGIWRYRPQGHALRQHLDRDVRDDLAEAAWRQYFIAEAPAIFAITAIFEVTMERYEERGRVRYVPMDVGHATENLTLQAVAMGLGSVSVGAFDDDAVSRVLDLPDGEVPMYLIPVGHPRAR
jgi:SagB-type dehydrogenase family enzyme